MQVCCFSAKKYLSPSRDGWHRGGFDFKYFRNKTNSTYFPMRDLDMMESESEEEEIEEKVRIQYTMSFTYTFEYDDDIVFFSHFYPYTLRDLEGSLEMIQMQ